MAIKKRRVRGLRDSIPGGFVIGRTGKGKGAPTLLAFSDIIAGARGGGGGGGASGATTIAIEMYCGGLMRANEVLGQFIAPREVTLSLGLSGSHAIASIASTGTLVLSIRRATAVGNGTEVGTITFTSSNVGVMSFTADTVFAIGQRLLVVVPALPDSTLANTTILFVGNLT